MYRYRIRPLRFLQAYAVGGALYCSFLIALRYLSHAHYFDEFIFLLVPFIFYASYQYETRIYAATTGIAFLLASASVLYLSKNLNSFLLSTYSITIYCSVILMAGEIIFQFATYQRNLIHEKEELIRQLETALAQVQTLSELLPICSHCKKIRNDQGYWQQIESYFTQHASTQFSHSLCPDCLEKYYPDFFQAQNKPTTEDTPPLS